jgi:hypothetical protein
MTEVAGKVQDVRDGADLVFDAALMRPWIVANLVGFTIGGALAGGVLRALIGPYFGTADMPVMEAARLQAIGSGLSAGILGLVVGAAQWLVLRQAIRAGWWLPATAAGWGAAGVLVGFSAGGSTSAVGPVVGPVNPLVSLLVVPPLIALLTGGGQWLVLRRDLAAVSWWPVVGFGVFLAAMFGGLTVAKLLPAIAGTQYPAARSGGVASVVAGPVYGYLSWQYLTQLRRSARGGDPS